MSTLQDIQHSIAQLSPAERDTLRIWIRELIEPRGVREPHAVYGGAVELANIQMAVQRLSAQHRRALYEWLNREKRNQQLLEDLATDVRYPTWSQYNAREAAIALQELLRASSRTG